MAAHKKVSWTDNEVEFLIRECHKVRKNNPNLSLIQILNNVQEQLPFERRRRITNNDSIKMISEGIKKIDNELYEAAEELKNIKVKLSQQLTKEGILNSLTDEEIIQRFKDRVLELVTPDEVLRRFPLETLLDHFPVPNLFGFAATQLLNALLEPKETVKIIEKEVQIEPPKKNKIAYKPRITLIGFLPDQAAEIKEYFKDRMVVHVVDKNREGFDAVPDNQDIYIPWVKFMSHSMYDIVKSKALKSGGKLIFHSGGLTNLIKRLEKEISGDV